MGLNGFTMSKKVVLKLVWCYFFVFLLLPGPSFECGPGRGVGRRRRPRKMTPLVFKQHVPNVSENTLGASGIAESRIHRGDPKFAELKTNHNPDIIFKNEEGTNADRKMTQRCKDKLNTLAISVMNQWSGIKLRVTEAWDEDSRHADNSLHYEGRAVDITTSDRDRSKYGMLARLAVEAGFDWVYYESRGHVHCSVKSDSSIAVKTGGCFPEKATVQVPGGHTIAMSELEVGQEVLAVSATGQLEYSEVLMFLDSEEQRRMQFIEIETDRNNRLTLTPSHLIYVTDAADVSMADISPIFARKVRTGQYIYVANKNTVELDRVVKVISRTDLGVYAPLTKHGTIVVNDVIASCYAVIESQDIAHASFIPLRLYHYVRSIFHTTTNSTLADKSPIQGQNGVHWYAELLHSLAWHILPRRLWFDL